MIDSRFEKAAFSSPSFFVRDATLAGFADAPPESLKFVGLIFTLNTLSFLDVGKKDWPRTHMEMVRNQ